MPQLSWQQVAAVAITVGWSPGDAVIATSITMPESSRISDNVQQGQPYATTGWGLWQITPGNSEPQFGIDQALLDPLNNGRAAHAKFVQAGGWLPWTTWQHGLNDPYIPDAQAAVAAVTGLPAATLAQLVAGARAGAPSAPTSQPAAANWSALVSHAAGSTNAKVAAATITANAITQLQGKWVPPPVTVPAPGTVVQPTRRVHGR